MHGEVTTTAAEPGPALVLGGGGAYGVIQAAYMLAAWDLGFRPRIVVGTSVGALNGAWFALHPERPDQLLRIWLSMDQLALVRWHPVKIAANLLHHPQSIASNEVVPRLVREHMSGARFDEARLELAVVATNLTKGEKHVFRTGSIPRAVLASTAIPGVFQPVKVGGDQFVDGCVTATVDMTTAFEMGATEILAIDLTPAPPLARPKTALGVLRQSFSILSTATTRAVETCLSRQLPVRVIRPDLSGNSPWKLEDSAGAVAHNLRLAREGLAGVFDREGHVAPEGTCWIDSADHGGGREGPAGPGRYFGRVRKAG
jgi:NTE family protein